MTKPERKIVKISLILIAMTFFSSAYFDFANAQENYVDEYDSIYRYNALENKVNFSNISNIIENNKNLKEIIPENDIAEDNIAENVNTQKLKEITEKQTDSVEKSEKAMAIIENEGEIKNFFLGNNPGTLKFQMAQMKAQSYDLKALLLKTEDYAVRNQINIQIELLEKEKKQVENFILKQDSRFSLFGWIINLL